MNRIYRGRVSNVEIPVLSTPKSFSAPDRETFAAGAAAKGVREVGSRQGRASGGEQVHVAPPDELSKKRKNGEVLKQPEWQPFDPDPKQAKAIGYWSSVIGHSAKPHAHQLFQDAVNF